MKDRHKSGEILIEVKNLCKAYGDHKVLEDVNTTVKKGEVISIIGPSGCGKSTFLRSINRLEKPEKGQIIYKGTDILDKNTDIKWEKFENKYRNDMNYHGKYKRVSKLMMMDHSPTVEKKCIPLFNEYVKETYGDLIKEV